MENFNTENLTFFEVKASHVGKYDVIDLFDELKFFVLIVI